MPSTPDTEVVVDIMHMAVFIPLSKYDIGTLVIDDDFFKDFVYPANRDDGERIIGSVVGYTICHCDKHSHNGAHEVFKVAHQAVLVQRSGQVSVKTED